jgi:hypothetical protein
LLYHPFRSAILEIRQHIGAHFVIKSRPSREFGITVGHEKKRNVLGGTVMTQIRTDLPAISYGVIERAAELSGSTVKSFVAQAALRDALEITRRVGEFAEHSEGEVLDAETPGLKHLKEIAGSPELLQEALDQAQNMSKNIESIPVSNSDSLR